MELLRTYQKKLSDNLGVLQKHLAAKESDDFHNIFIFCVSCACNFWIGIIWGATYLASGTNVAFLPPLIYSIVDVMSFAILYFFQKYRLFFSIQLWSVLVLPVILSIILGGLKDSGAVVMWSILAPAGAVICGSKKDITLYSVAFVCLFLLEGIRSTIGIMDATQYFRIDALPPVLTTPMLTFNILGPAVITIYLIIYKQRQALYYSNKLLTQNAVLSSALEDLKKAQSELVHSTKMASLGELIAGISHEINTPAGAILNALEEVKRYYLPLLDTTTRLLDKLDQAEQQSYMIACKQVVNFCQNNVQEFATSEVRSIARDMEEKVSILGGDNTRVICKNLATVGFNKDNIDSVIELLKSNYSEDIQNTLFDLGMSQLHIHNISIAISRIIRLVKALKIHSHTDNQSLIMTDLHEDINSTLIILQSKIKGHSIMVKQELQADLPKLHCYADQLNQVWTNLINNAIDSIQNKGTICIRARSDTKNIYVEVEDDGPGIAEHVKATLFTPYVTTKPKGVGTGLGLSISREIVLKHAGDISFTSQPGKTIFSVIIPINNKFVSE